MKKFLLSLVLMTFAGYMSAQSLTFKYEGNTVEPGTIDLVSDINSSMEIQFDLHVINATDADINVVCEMESDPSNQTQDYFCWGTCYMPGVLTGSNNVAAGGEGIFNGHVMFVDANGNTLPSGSTSKMTYTLYGEDNPDEKYTFVVNFKYEAEGNETTTAALAFKYEGNAIEPGTIDLVSDINSSMEIQFDLHVINTTDADIKVICDMASDPSNLTQDYLCWGTCYMPGVVTANNTVTAGGEGIFNGHVMFVDADGNTLPVGSESKITYTFYDERNPEEKYTFNVNFKYQPDAIEEINTVFSNAYPNPANNTLSFNYEMQNANSAAVAIYNMMGQEVVRQALNLGNSRVDINVSDLNEGVYFYSLIVNNQTVKTNKFVVSR